jgi:hypothetical protein
MMSSQIIAALEKVRKLREEQIVLRRGETTIAAQPFRVERLQKAQMYRDDASRTRRADVVLLGALTANIQVDDRFTVDNILYRVNFIQPNRSVATLAEAIVVQ